MSQHAAAPSPSETSPGQPVNVWARVDDSRQYHLERELMTYDAIPVLAVVRSTDGHPHLALMADETSDTLTYVLAQLAHSEADVSFTTSAQLHALIMRSTRTARLTLTFDDTGQATAVEVVVPVDQLDEDELPTP